MNRPSSSSAPIPIATRLAEKQRELAHLLQLQEMSASLVSELELLEDRLNNLADGTEKVAVVLQNWGNIVRALTLASSNLTTFREEDYENRVDPPLPETLVRIRINNDEDEPTNNEDSDGDLIELQQ